MCVHSERESRLEVWRAGRCANLHMPAQLGPGGRAQPCAMGDRGSEMVSFSHRVTALAWMYDAMWSLCMKVTPACELHAVKIDLVEKLTWCEIASLDEQDVGIAQRVPDNGEGFSVQHFENVTRILQQRTRFRTPPQPVAVVAGRTMARDLFDHVCRIVNELAFLGPVHRVLRTPTWPVSCRFMAASHDFLGQCRLSLLSFSDHVRGGLGRELDERQASDDLMTLATPGMGVRRPQHQGHGHRKASQAACNAGCSPGS